MDLSLIGRAALRAREGEKLTAYRDSKNVLTIGVGITSASGLIKVTPGLKITAAQSDALFAKAVESYVETVRNALHKPVPQPFFDACVSLCYNIGQPGFTRSSVVRLANEGNLAKAVDAFLLWNKPAEILSRRQGERDQALLPAYGTVYARRGDKHPVAAVAEVAAAPAPAPGLLARLRALFTRKAA